MKSFKYMSMIGLAALLPITWVGCSDKEDALGITNPDEAKAYATVAIAVPNGTTETRAGHADDGSDVTEVGLPEEYKVTKATLYLFPTGEGNLQTVNINAFTKMEKIGQKVVWTSKKTALTPGNYRIYIVANGAIEGVNETMTEDEFKDKVVSGTDVQTSVSGDGLVMTSRTNGVSYITQTITTDPEQMIVADVERVMGKITVTAENNNKYTFEDAKSNIKNIVSDITLTGHYVINMRNEGYYFRHVGYESKTSVQVGADSSDELPYVIDPKTYDKTFATDLATDYTTWYNQLSSKVTTITAFAEMPSETETAVAAYCYENTMLKNMQKSGYTTGIVFKAAFTPKASAIVGTVAEVDTKIYYHSGKFYASLDELQKVIPTLDVTTADKLNNSLKENDVQCFDRSKTNKTMYVCYYTYWIKHNPSQDVKEDVMEFAIVRNNVYQVKVTGINGLGVDGNTDKIIPDDKETVDPTDVMLNVRLTIKPWIVRANDAVLG